MNLVFEPLEEHVIARSVYRAAFHVQKLCRRSSAYALSRVIRKIARLAGITAAPEVIRMGGPCLTIGKKGQLRFGGSVYLEEMVQIKARGLVEIGDEVRVRQGTVIVNNGFDRLVIGDRTNIGEYAVVMTRGPLIIGQDCMISPGCVVVAETHGTLIGDERYIEQEMTSTGIRIHDNVWLGSNVTVLDGVTIGEGAIVAAGSTVMKNVPPHTLSAGVPARVVKSLVRDADGVETNRAAIA